ncbi:hypothetical protein Pmar_PMAR011658 [Perkinsus marinus ATCC 50983]|uniref:Uncharacterized protein n=1 Tax=Perkinsus marinus (strain ATCC 50983 / TXsc) TaxID=423536 RepID=C5LCE7_PERM5|nr:hypothetical protein Pmar_PMAR011658 [Perkinsus marinus ATCC 50983]EER05630.1 hypothetical protein Pmar_PMAR011658 [Perkinsus marinus ATCC 50983]|eukprot:XP_002773814.1 hypothetical protein Pmar_PMAR011658 [Perkinsus marinus ATCC 50983]
MVESLVRSDMWCPVEENLDEAMVTDGGGSSKRKKARVDPGDSCSARAEAYGRRLVLEEQLAALKEQLREATKHQQATATSRPNLAVSRAVAALMEKTKAAAVVGEAPDTPSSPEEEVDGHDMTAGMEAYDGGHRQSTRPFTTVTADAVAEASSNNPELIALEVELEAKLQLQKQILIEYYRVSDLLRMERELVACYQRRGKHLEIEKAKALTTLLEHTKGAEVDADLKQCQLAVTPRTLKAQEHRTEHHAQLAVIQSLHIATPIMKGRRHRFQELGGSQVMSVISEVSESSVLAGPAFTEEERKFLMGHLRTEVAEFSVATNFQIFVRCLLQPTTKTESQARERSQRRRRERQGEWVLAIHDYGNLTTSWTWIKVLAELGVNRCRVLACYEGAGLLFKLLMKYPNLVGSHHVLYNVEAPHKGKGGNGIFQPVIDDGALDAECSLLRLTAKIRALGSAFNVLIASDRCYHGDLGRPDVFEVTRRTFNVLTALSQDQFCKDRVTITTVTRHEIAERVAYKAEQPGVDSIRILYGSMYFRVYVAEFIAGSQLPPYAAV